MSCLDTTELFGESVEDIHELGEPPAALGLALGNPVGHARFDVKPENREADAIERRFRGGELLQNLDAETRLLHHPADAAHLTFDAIEPCDESLLLRFVEHRVLSLLRSDGAPNLPILAARSGRRYAAVPSGPRLRPQAL